MWWYRRVILAVERLRPEDCKFKASLGNTGKKKKKASLASTGKDKMNWSPNRASLGLK
jgi:hypothetical protein